MLLHLLLNVFSVDVGCGEVVPVEALVLLVELAQPEVLHAEVAELIVVLEGVHVDV